jgi:hypothetical protein
MARAPLVDETLNMPDSDQGGSTNIESGGDTTIGGDVVGRDKITTTTTNTTSVGQDAIAGDKVTQTTITSTTNVEGGPTTRTAIIGVIIIAALAIIVLAAVIFGGGGPGRPTPTLSATPVIPTSTFAIAMFTDTPIPATTEPPSPIPSITPTPTLSSTPTPTDTSFPTNTPTLTLTPSPTSALGLYDDFNDQCLDDARWDFKVPPAGEGTPTPTPIPAQGSCLEAADQFLTEDRDGHLTVFLTLEGDEANSLIQKSNACYKEVEVLVALHDVIVFDENVRTAYLSVGVSVARVSGPSFVEVRLEGGNSSGRFRAQITSRLTLLGAGGPTTLAVLPYTLDQLVRVAFRVDANTGRLNVYVDGQPVTPDQGLSIKSDPCGLTLGYHADTQTLLDGYFDEARLEPLP